MECCFYTYYFHFVTHRLTVLLKVLSAVRRASMCSQFYYFISVHAILSSHETFHFKGTLNASLLGVDNLKFVLCVFHCHFLVHIHIVRGFRVTTRPEYSWRSCKECNVLNYCITYGIYLTLNPLALLITISATILILVTNICTHAERINGPI